MSPSDLQLFCEVYERRSFSGAARALGLDPSVVSRRIRGLEQRLSGALFLRTTRAVSPTEAANTFYDRIAPALRDIKEAELEVGTSGAALKGPLRISAPGAMGRHLIAPIAFEFAAENPEVEMQLHLSDRRMDLVKEGIDIAIRVGTPTAPNLTIKPLGHSEQWLVAAPDYLKDRQPPRESLKGHKVVLRMEGGGIMDIRDTLSPEQHEGFEISLISDDVGTTADAARAGLGIAALPSWLIAKDVERGDLIHIDFDAPNHRAKVYAALPARRNLTKRARAFLDRITQAWAPL